MKYSFSEAAHEKCVKIVEMDGSGRCVIERINLRPRYDVRRIAGTLDQLLKEPSTAEDRNDYLHIDILDAGAIYDPIGKLREVYPNVLELGRPNLVLRGEGARTRYDHREHSEGALFEAFYKQTTGEDLSDKQAKAFASIVDGIRRDEREAGS
jgi:exonuclease SbcD